MAIECNPAECPTGKDMAGIHDTLIRQTTTLEMFMGVVERDRTERRESEKQLFKEVGDVKVGLEKKADKEKTISKGGVIILLSVVSAIFIVLGFVANVL